MSENDDSRNAASALQIMRQWQWTGGDPDGNLWGISLSLSEVTSRLAMEGISQPQDAVLSLLCQGDLSASGDYRWRKYQGDNHFQLEGTGAPIKRRQWQGLADSIKVEQLASSDEWWGLQSINLPELKLLHYPSYSWEFSANRFSTAHDKNDQEEWFSAWDIEVSRAWPDDEFLLCAPEPVIPKPTAPATNKGGRPPAADWEVAALEMAGRYYQGDFKPQTIADVCRELTAWLADQDSHPSDSVVRVHAKRIFEAFQAWEQD